MREERVFSNRRKLFGIFFLALLFTCFLPRQAHAQVTISPGKNDRQSIQDALDRDGNVVLKPGTYHTNGNIYVSSNQSITATGATIITQNGAVRNTPAKADYQSIVNFTLDGGTWMHESADGYTKTMVQLSHGSNIRILNATILANYTGHALELIACRDVTVQGCTLQSQGSVSKSSSCHEEMLQIDLSTPRTAPTLPAALQNGATCENITVDNCTVTGCRGICSNYAASESKFKSNFHKNIVINNCRVTGISGEGVALFNVAGAKVTNSTIVSTCSNKNSSYSVGLHFHTFGKSSAVTKASYTATGNVVKGGRQGLYFASSTSTKFGKAVVKKNKCYAKKGKWYALVLSKVKKKSKSGNKLYKGKGY